MWEGVSRRRHPVAGPRPARLGKAGGKLPAVEAADEPLPEGSHDPCHVQQQAVRALHDAPTGLQHVALKAPQIEATAGRRFVLDPQHRRQVEGQQRQP